MKFCNLKASMDIRSTHHLFFVPHDLFFIIWYKILGEVKKAQKYLQRSGISLGQCTVKLMLENWCIKIVEKAIDYIRQN